MDRTRFVTRSGAGARRGAKVVTTTPSRRRSSRGCAAAAAAAAAAGARSRISTGTAGPSPGDAGVEAGTDASRRGRTRAASRATGRPRRGTRSHFVIHRLASSRFSRSSRPFVSVNRQLFSLKVTSLITQKVVTENEMKREYVSPERTLPRDPTELEKPTAIPARSADSREQSLVNSNALSDRSH